MKASFSPFATVLALLLAFCMTCTYNDTPEEELIVAPNQSSESQKWASGEVSFMENNLFPEGVEYDKSMKRFLLSSITRGTIGIVGANGAYWEWINDPDIPSTLGIHIDQPRKRLLVAVADLGFSTKSSPETSARLAGLAAYDLRSGERLFYTRMDELLPGLPHFANDVTVDQQGNAYVTDSFTGAIYKVDPDGAASVYYQNDALNPAPGAFGLNGIDYDPRGFLIVSKLDENKLLRFPINNPDAYTQISVPMNLPNPDGLTLKNNKELVVVANALGGENAKVVTLRSNDMWQSTEVIDVFETGSVFPTTAAVRPGGDVFVLYAYLHVLLGGGSQSEFQIVEVE